MKRNSESDHGEGAERRSAYAKASDFAEASASALCAMADKTADKSEDKYEIGGEGVEYRICRGFTKLLHDLHVLHG